MVEVGIGIDVGGTDIKYGLVTRAGVVRKRAALRTLGGEGGRASSAASGPRSPRGRSTRDACGWTSPPWVWGSPGP